MSSFASRYRPGSATREAPKLLRLRSVVRGSKGGLLFSSGTVAGGAGTELSPAAGRSRFATLTWRAKDRASFTPPRAPGAIEAVA